jgi:hypothetical protein
MDVIPERPVPFERGRMARGAWGMGPRGWIPTEQLVFSAALKLAPIELAKK